MTASYGPHAPKSALAGIRAALRDAEFDEAPALFEQLCVASCSRQETHLQRIRSEARRLGFEVGSYRMTLTDAQKRLERLCDTRVEASPVPLRLVPWHVGLGAARESFAAGMAHAQRRAA